jgi:hypothetical protein
MNSYSKTSATSSHSSNISKQSRQGKTVARSSRKEVALPAKGGNSSAAKNKNLMKCQECNRQCKQADQANPPRKPPPERANISDFARAAAREQPKADQEWQAQNAEWRRLHEMGSLVAYLNHDEQLHENKFSDKSDGSELSEEETEKMQKDELDKCKAWGSLRIPTKEAAMASPQKKQSKTRQDSQSTNPTDGRFCLYYRRLISSSSIVRATYPVPQSSIGYCPSLDFDGNFLTRSTAV